MTSFPYFIHAITPLHVGGGEALLGVEQAIARNPVTGLPLIPGSGVKGVLRARSEALRSNADPPQPSTEAVFGKAPGVGSGHAGSITFHDATLLALPIRSAAGTFAWATSPHLLRLHARDISLFCSSASETSRTPKIPELDADQMLLGSPGDHPLVAAWGDTPPRAVLEDLVLRAEPSSLVDEWWTYLSRAGAITGTTDVGLARRFCIVHDDVMFFLARFAIKVDARNRLGGRKTVEDFWHEEALPGESLLAGIATIERTPRSGLTSDGEVHKAISGLVDRPVQLGGNATVGRGVCRMVAGALSA
jgi:CRISPR-associated protein Cmr4